MSLLTKILTYIRGLEVTELKAKKRVTISNDSCSSGNRTRTCDLRVMSPTSYLLLYPAIWSVNI